MAQLAQNVIQHDFGFPRLVRADDAERAALYAMLVSLGATKTMAERLMQDFPQHGTACQAIVDLASDGEGDIRGAVAQLDGEQPWHRDRGGVELDIRVTEPIAVVQSLAARTVSTARAPAGNGFNNSACSTVSSIQARQSFGCKTATWRL
jgi:hypothetical protein